MKELFLSLLMLSLNQGTVNAGINKQKEDTKTYVWFTDMNGCIDPRSILNAKIEQNVRFYATDGSKFDGIVESIKTENDQFYKIFGTITNRNSAAFGFAISKDGNFAGSIILQDDEVLYIVEPSESLKSLVIVKATESKENNNTKTTTK